VGIFKWLKNKTYAPAAVADNAVKQYQKAKYRNLGDTPKETAEFMWRLRYLHATLDSESQKKLYDYIESEFPIDTVVDFCLGTFDIEFHFGPSDLDTYDYAADHIGKELAKNNIPCTKSDICSFINKWNKLIAPLR